MTHETKAGDQQMNTPKTMSDEDALAVLADWTPSELGDGPDQEEIDQIRAHISARLEAADRLVSALEAGAHSHKSGIWKLIAAYRSLTP